MRTWRAGLWLTALQLGAAGCVSRLPEEAKQPVTGSRFVLVNVAPFPNGEDCGTVCAALAGEGEKGTCFKVYIEPHTEKRTREVCELKRLR